VFLTAAAFVIRYRRPGDAQTRTVGTDPRQRHLFAYEVGFLVLLMVLFLSWWSVGSNLFVRMRVAPDDALDVYVTAKQWMWKFGYPNGRRAIAVLHVPAHRPVKLVMTSRDVIHSFYVPDFRIKEDVLPGRYTTVWFEATEPGVYEILCTEYCGASHSFMRGQVIALDPSDYQRWLDQPGEEPAVAQADDLFGAPENGNGALVNLVNEGERVAAEQGCLRCHTTDGSAHVGPTWAGFYGSTVALADGKRVVADEAYITESMMDPLVEIARGYEPLMPSYLGRIRPAETAAIIEFIKSLRGVPRQGPDGTDPGPARLGSVLP
jgi:cytochrome c oxidase subunit II